MKGKFVFSKTFCLAGLIPLLMFCACQTKTKTYEPTFSVDSSQKKILLYGVPTQSYYEIHSAFVRYLNERLDGIHLQIVASSSFSAYVDKLENRLYDVALANGVIALDSTRIGYSILGTSVEEQANAGLILVNTDSSINNVSDLKGKTIASTGSPALGGHMLPMLYLFKKGLNVNKEIKLKYLESFESVILNIYLGKCSAGFTTLNGWNSFLKKRPEVASKVRIKWETPAVVGNPLLIRNTVSKKTVSQLKNLILNMHLNERGRKALADIGYLKFIPADSTTYQPFKEFLKEYQALIVDPKK
jgi:phosphonate transport system substrate-binding protein